MEDLYAMEDQYTIPMSNIIDKYELEALYLPDLPQNIKITRSRVNRPGLQMAGYFDYYERERLQIIGKMESHFINNMPPEQKAQSLDRFFASVPAGVIFTSSLPVSDDIIACAEQYKVPLLRTGQRTSEFMAALIAYLNVELGPRITRHGVLVEVYGEGILLLLFGISSSVVMPK